MLSSLFFLHICTHIANFVVVHRNHLMNYIRHLEPAHTAKLIFDTNSVISRAVHFTHSYIRERSVCNTDRVSQCYYCNPIRVSENVAHIRMIFFPLNNHDLRNPHSYLNHSLLSFFFFEFAKNTTFGGLILPGPVKNFLSYLINSFQYLNSLKKTRGW